MVRVLTRPPKRRRGVSPGKIYAHLRGKVPFTQCDRCNFAWPETMIRMKDGAKTCPNHGAWAESIAERDEYKEKTKARVAKEEAKEKLPKWPQVPETRGLSGVSGISPTPPIQLLRGGATKDVVLSGVNLSAADTITYSHATVETVSTVYSALGADGASNTATVTVRAKSAGAGGINGMYDLIFNLEPFRNIFQVRD
jgi:uncharacterized Zn finger protein (UPF0148 family)